MRSLLIPSDGPAFRRNHFNTMRLAMALLVVWSHCFALYLGSEDNEPISLLLNGHYNAGNIGVRVFFIISGFLIARSYERSSGLLDYFDKRVRRIYPGYLVAVAICSFVVVPLFSTKVDLGMRTLAEWTWRNLFLQGYIPPSNAFSTNPLQATNGALWSIPFEFWCYIAIAIFGASGLLKRRWLVLIVTVAIMLTKTWLDITGRKPGGGFIGHIIGWPYLWFSMAPCFLMGSLAYLFRTHLPRSGSTLLIGALALLTSAHIFGPSRLAFDLLFPFIATFAVFYAAFSPVGIPDAARFGDFSYGAYLYGFPIQQMLKARSGLPFELYVPASLGLSIAAGIASWHLVERFFQTVSSPRPSRAAANEALP